VAAVSAREHAPWCETSLGPDFEVEPDVVRMTIFICEGFECWNQRPDE